LLSLLQQKGFITESPLPPNHFEKDTPGSRLTFMGHSSLLVQTGKATLLTDPYLRLDDGLPENGMDAPRIRLNAIVCSHSHWDHCDLQSFLWFDKDTLLIVPQVKQPTAFNPPIIEAMKMLGFCNFKEVELWKPIQIEDIELVLVPFHGEQDEPNAVIDHFTYVLKTNDLCVYAGVDSYRDTFGDMIPVLEKIREQYHPELAFLPVSKVIYRYEWGGVNGFCRYLDTTLVKQTFQYTASPEDAAEWVKALRPRWVAPYALFNFAPWSTPSQIPEFEKALKQANLQKFLFPFRPFDFVDAPDLANLGSRMRKLDRRMQQNRIYRYLRYRGKRATQPAEHH
jgi:L-ascorbate metabolism protein UlaG (beta-lactamase superfamily)